MMFLNQIINLQNITDFLSPVIIAIISGFVSSLLTYYLITRQQMKYKIKLETEREKKERIRQEVVRWANPILSCVRELKNRLDNILELEGYFVLSKNCEGEINPNWSITHDYFLNSTLFLFGQYFAWIQMFRNELSFELFESQKEKDEFFTNIRKVSKSLRDFPPYYICKGKDVQIFALQQKTIGDLFIVLNEVNERECMNYPEFLLN